MIKNTAAKRAARVAGALLAATGLVAAGASGAQAASKDGVINTGEFVQWYNSGYSGGCEDDYSADGSFYNDLFKNCGQGAAGVGQVVANNTRSYYNYDYSWSADVYTGTFATGWKGHVGPRTGGNYNLIFSDNVESLYWHL